MKQMGFEAAGFSRCNLHVLIFLKFRSLPSSQDGSHLCPGGALGLGHLWPFSPGAREVGRTSRVGCREFGLRLPPNCVTQNEAGTLPCCHHPNMPSLKLGHFCHFRRLAGSSPSTTVPCPHCSKRPLSFWPSTVSAHRPLKLTSTWRGGVALMSWGYVNPGEANTRGLPEPSSAPELEKRKDP